MLSKNDHQRPRTARFVRNSWIVALPYFILFAVGIVLATILPLLAWLRGLTQGN